MATDPTAELRAEVDRLVAAAREGDRAAFDELVRRTYVDTYTLAMRLTANEEDARDVVQESYLRAWKGIKRFRGDASFSTCFSPQLCLSSRGKLIIADTEPMPSFAVRVRADRGAVFYP